MKSLVESGDQTPEYRFGTCDEGAGRPGPDSSSTSWVAPLWWCCTDKLRLQIHEETVGMGGAVQGAETPEALNPSQEFKATSERRVNFGAILRASRGSVKQQSRRARRFAQ